MIKIPLLRRVIPGAIFLIAFFIFTFRAFNFLSIANLINILQVITFIAVPATGLAIVMLSGKFDLSFAGVIGISAAVSIYFTNKGMHPLPALLITLLLAVALELVNAFFVVILGIHPWLTTIGTMLVYLGLEKAITGGHYYTADSSFFQNIRFGTFLGLPVVVWIMLLVWLVVVFIIHRTTLGRCLYAVGGNENACINAGIDSRFYSFIAFGMMGFLSWAGSIIYVGQLSGYPPEAAYINQLEVILAVFFGMALSTKGIINVVGALLGAAFVAFLANGMGLLGISSYWIKFMEGLLVVVVIIGNSISQGRLVHLE